VERVVSNDLRARVAFGGGLVEGDTCDSEVGWKTEEEFFGAERESKAEDREAELV